MKRKFALSYPRSWREMTPELLSFYLSQRLFTESKAELQVLVMLKANRLTLLDTEPDRYIFLWRGLRTVILPREAFNAAVLQLAFIHEPPAIPTAPAKIFGFKVKDAFLRDISFGDWMAADALIHSFFADKSPEAIYQAAGLLLSKRIRRIKNDERRMKEASALLFWVDTVKRHLYSFFPHLFPSSSADSLGFAGTSPAYSPKKAIDAMLRALTDGDITKEEAILKCNLYRAFTQLDALAKESAEFKQKYDKK